MYNMKLSIIVIVTIRPPVLKYRPWPSVKNSLFDNARRYVEANTIKIPYTQYNTPRIKYVPSVRGKLPPIE